MKNVVDKEKRSFIKKALLAAGAILALNNKRARAQHQGLEGQQEEILYRETEAFKRYYQSLRD